MAYALHYWVCSPGHPRLWCVLLLSGQPSLVALAIDSQHDDVHGLVGYGVHWFRNIQCTQYQ